MAVDADEASRFDELVDELTVPVPAPREPARELAFGRDDGCAHAGAEEVAERFARTSFVGGLRYASEGHQWKALALGLVCAIAIVLRRDITEEP